MILIKRRQFDNNALPIWSSKFRVYNAATKLWEIFANCWYSTLDWTHGIVRGEFSGRSFRGNWRKLHRAAKPRPRSSLRSLHAKDLGEVEAERKNTWAFYSFNGALFSVSFPQFIASAITCWKFLARSRSRKFLCQMSRAHKRSI